MASFQMTKHSGRIVEFFFLESINHSSKVLESDTVGVVLWLLAHLQQTKTAGKEI